MWVHVGYFLEEGIGGQVDVEAAWRLYTAAAEKGVDGLM